MESILRHNNVKLNIHPLSIHLVCLRVMELEPFPADIGHGLHPGQVTSVSQGRHIDHSHSISNLQFKVSNEPNLISMTLHHPSPSPHPSMSTCLLPLTFKEGPGSEGFGSWKQGGAWWRGRRWKRRWKRECQRVALAFTMNCDGPGSLDWSITVRWTGQREEEKRWGTLNDERCHWWQLNKKYLHPGIKVLMRDTFCNSSCTKI